MIDLGTVKPGSTIRIPFSTFDKDDGSSVTMTNFAVGDILIYKDGSTTERASTAGYTATTDFDSKTGKQVAVIDLADNTTAGFFSAGSEYLVAIDAVTVDGVTTGGWIARFRIGYPGAILDTTIATLSSQTSFTLTSGPAEDDALNGREIIIHDVASAVQMGSAIILDYTGATKTVTLAAGTTFTAAASDNVSVMGYAPLMPTVQGRTLDVAVTGEAGLDYANVNTYAAGAFHPANVIDSGTAQSVTATTLVLRAAAAFATGELVGSTIVIRSATTGAGQRRIIRGNVGSTDTVVVDSWTTTPTGTILYDIIGTAPAVLSEHDRTLAAVVQSAPIGYYRGEHGCYDATSGGNLVTALGTAIKRWEPYVGTTGNLTQSTTGSAPVRGLNNDVVFYFGQAGWLSCSISLDKRAHSVFVIAELLAHRGGYTGSGNAGPQTLYNNSTAGQLVHAMISRESGNSTGNRMQIYDDGVGDYRTTTSIALTSQLTVIGFTAGSGALTAYTEDGWTTTSPLASGTFTVDGLFGRSASAWPVHMRVRELLIYDREVPSYEVQNVIVPRAKALGMSASKKHCVVFAGDSITHGGIPSDTTSRAWPALINIDPTVRRRNVSETAITLATLDSEYADRIAPLYRPGEINVLWIFAGTNDCSGGATGSAIYTSLTNIVTKARATGFDKIGVTTMLPRSSFDATQNTHRSTFNTSIRNSVNVFDDYVDTDTSTSLDQHSDFPDGVHPSGTGQQVIADLTGPKIARFLWEATNAVQDARLDHLAQHAISGSDVTDNSALAKLVSKSSTADWDSFNNTTDALEALRDRGDAAWITATGFSTHSAADIWSVATRTLTAGTNIQLPSNGLANISAWTVNITGTLSGTVGGIAGTTQTLDALQTALNSAHGSGSWATATGFSTHSAADVWSVGTRTLTGIDEDSTTLDLDATIRGAVGLSSANLDTQLSGINAKTTNLPSDPADASDIAASFARFTGLVAATGTIGSTGNDATHVHLAGLTYGDDEINNWLLVIFDVSNSEYHSRWVEDWADSGDLATVATLPFTPQNATDTYWLLPIRQDVTGGSGLDAAGVRAAIGLASANLDTQLSAIDDYIDTEVSAIKVKTDTLPTFPSNFAALVIDASGRIQVQYGTSTGQINAASGVASVTVTGMANNVITSSVIATDAIGAAQIAADAIGSSEIAASAVSEIQSGLSTLDASGVRSAVGLASANLDTQLTTIVNYIDTEVAAIKTVTDQFTAAQAEPVAVPAANATPLEKIAWLAMMARNKVTQTATTQTVLADNGSTTVATSTISDDGTTFTRGEFA